MDYNNDFDCDMHDFLEDMDIESYRRRNAILDCFIVFHFL